MTSWEREFIKILNRRAHTGMHPLVSVLEDQARDFSKLGFVMDVI
jgi:hypothetical protein